MKSMVVGVISLSFLIFLTKFTNGLYMSGEVRSVNISSRGSTSMPSESIKVN